MDWDLWVGPEKNRWLYYQAFTRLIGEDIGTMEQAALGDMGCHYNGCSY